MNSFNADVFHTFQNKLKIGNRRGVHLNAIPGNSRYKLDLARLSNIYKSLPEHFILDLLTQRNMKFSFSVHDNQTEEVESKSTTNEIYLNDYDEDLKNKREDLRNVSQEEQREILLKKLAMSFDNLIFQNEVIQSEKGINSFGFGFPILIRKDVNDGQITAAPLLIWSLKIKQSGEMNTWEISRTEEDPIYMNEVLMNHLQSDSGITLDPISMEMLEDGKIDKPELHAICTSVLNKLKINQPLDFLLNNYERIPLLKTKATYDKQLEKKGDAVIEKSGIFSLFEVQKQNIINDYESLKTQFKAEQVTKTSFQSITPIETDPSQQGILEVLKSQSKILIQGPPGTGKSQTLTAVLVNALQNKQKTIVVCEKQTALEVLYNALEKQGLGKYCVMIKDNVTDRRLVVDAVRNTIDNTEFKKQISFYPESFLAKQLKSIERAKTAINTVHNTLNLELIDNKDWKDVVGNILEYKAAKEPVDLSLFDFKFTNDEFLELEQLFKKEPLYQQFKPFANDYLYNPQKLTTENKLSTRQNLNESFSKYKENWSTIQKNTKDYQQYYYNKRKEEFASQYQNITDLINETAVITSTLNEQSDVFNTEKTNGFFYKLFSFLSSEKKKAIKNQKRLLTIGEKIKGISLHENFLSIEISNNLWNNKNEILAYREKIDRSKNEFSTTIEKDFQELDYFNFFQQHLLNEDLDKIIKNSKQLKTDIQNENWLNDTDFGLTYKDFSDKINTVFGKYEEYNSNADNPFSAGYEWFVFYNSLSDFQKKCLNVLYSITNWQTSFLYAYFNLLLKRKALDFTDFNESKYSLFKDKIQIFSSSQKNFIENYWNVSQQNAVKEFEQKNKDITVANLYNKRKSTNHNRLPLRKIAMKDTDLFTTFFPIILTTPDICCNLFQGKNYYFDNVVFDEASQLKLEDNLPALLKGKNVIIAGDEHQMPPSNYFSKVFDGSFEDEDDIEDENEVISFKNALLNIESLLDFALEFRFDKNHLDFHYRSKHPYLIDFSNHAFYNSRLKPLPSFNQSIPIEFFEVGGTFNEHINIEEAEKVLEILENIQPKPDGNYPSVGIATFNITQRNYIRRKIIEKQNINENESFRQKIANLEKAGLFIKNLENIQGDERDIIIISTTYGKKHTGKFIQSFGPINHTKGYKLLNVIITRAKEKIYICNSIPTEYYANYKDALATEGSNNKRAVLYAYLSYCKAVSNGDENKRLEVLNELDKYGNKQSNTTTNLENNFKKQIYNSLIQKYPHAKIALNYAFGGYTIDIFIETTNKKSIAIECMSKNTYYGNLAYLEDMHKEKVLKNSGFEYVRIWSQNCWQDIDTELKKVETYI